MTTISAPFDRIVQDLFLIQQERRFKKITDVDLESNVLAERFANYPYLVKLPKLTWHAILRDNNEIETWCRENCQQEYIYQWVSGKTLGNDFVIDVTGKEAFTVFAFKNLQDANLFTLRWS